MEEYLALCLNVLDHVSFEWPVLATVPVCYSLVSSRASSLCPEVGVNATAGLEGCRFGPVACVRDCGL